MANRSVATARDSAVETARQLLGDHPEDVAQKDSGALSEICVLFYEMEAVVSCLDDAIEALHSDASKSASNTAKGLTMALDRTIKEVGRQAGAI